MGSKYRLKQLWMPSGEDLKKLKVWLVSQALYEPASSSLFFFLSSYILDKMKTTSREKDSSESVLKQTGCV